MFTRITELWPNLLRRQGILQEQEDQVPDAGQELSDLVRRDLEETFSNLLWSRVVSVQETHDDLIRTWPMFDDIVQEREQLLAPDYPHCQEFIIHFEPSAFQLAHQELSVETYQLRESELLQWARTTTRIRARFQRMM